ncbi:MAG: hypothetical protein FD141_1567 [Fusobacteria bacterium]|nr:MAG: hypothetical protein FD141_1567 [Fusobacteriota bacterium]KAF0230280.1 MAG: hypothetical protein FD182_670 [Fusobacteriota bacterium]
MSKIVFKEATKKYLPILDQYIPLVARVHGGSHPEFHDINKLYDSIKAKIKKTGPEIADLMGEFTKLREISNNYTTPDDVCESYEAVYQMLAMLDEKYNS